MAKAAMKTNKRGPSTLSQQSSSEQPFPVPVDLSDTLTGNAIPNPDQIQTRKASIHVQSKLIS